MRIKNLVFALFLISPIAYSQQLITDDQLELLIIENSIYNYNSKGICPCPYSIDAAGNICGANSAWSQPGSTSYCYLSDVTPEVIQIFRQQNEIPYTDTTGVVTRVYLPSNNLARVSGIDGDRRNFVFNGIAYHSITSEGCNSVIPGMYLTIVQNTYARTAKYSNHTVIFRLPNETRCLAIRL